MSAPDPPASLLPHLDGLAWRRDGVGESGCRVWSFGRAGSPQFFLKSGTGRFLTDLVDEYVRLEWLSGLIPVPAIRGFVREEEQAWLLTSALPGRMAEELFEEEPGRRLALTEALTRFLVRLHALPISACPFDARLPFRLAAARRNIDAGLVDAEDFDPEREGWSAEQVWEELHRLLPLSLAHVVTHGDFSLGNLMVDGDDVSGCLDVGRAGTADPYQDLAILWNSVRTLGSELEAALWRTYGIAAPDEARLRLHLLLDELF